ncbi:MAG: MFS transporter [Flavobacteriales bacterium]
MVKGDPKIIRAWTMYDWANSSYSLTISSAIFPIFYGAITVVTLADGGTKDLVMEAHGVPAQTAYSWALSAGFLLVALISPLLSGIADHLGNKKRFLQFFCYLGASACAGLAFFTLENLFLGLGLLMVACVGFSGSLIFYDAFLPEIAEKKDHDRISARGYTMGYIGSVILLVINLAMVMAPDFFHIPATVVLPSWLGGRELGGIAARISFISVAIWWAGWAQIAFRRLPVGSPGPHRGMGVFANGYRELRKVWGELGHATRLKRYLAAFFLFNMGIQTVMYLAVNFAQQEIKDHDPRGAVVPIDETGLITSILLIQLVAAIGAALFVRLSKRFGNVRALMMGAIAWIGLCVAAYFTHWAIEFYFLASGVGLVMGGCQALSRSTYAKFLPPTEDTASYFSFYDVSFYLGTVLGTFAYGAVYAITGDLRNTVIAIGSFFVVGFLLLLRVPKEETVPAAIG